MVKDCRACVVLVDECTRPDAHKLDAPGIMVIKISDLENRESLSSTIASAATADSIAAILYTSGSSGTPKGNMLNHRGLFNWIEHAHLYGLRSEVVLQQTSSTFDLSLIQISTAICHGGTLLLVPRRLRGDASAIGDIIAEYDVTFTL